jgi:ubiquinone/menaquinone biosynthesis C-methylase UbiE
MIPRVLEPEVMDTPEEAADYDAMDHVQVNRLFVDDLLSALGSAPQNGSVLDVGTGTALIPIELARRGFAGAITGVDLAHEMLVLGRRNIKQAQLTNILLERVDAKQLPYADGAFDVVMSNSIVHHIPQPDQSFVEMRRVLAPGGLLFVRDLLRPASHEEVERLVACYAGGESPSQQQLFRQSLHAALTLEELASLLEGIHVDTGGLAQTSDRHWTLCWRREAER